MAVSAVLSVAWSSLWMPPFLKLLVNMVLGDRHGIIWVEEARSILGMKEAA